MVLEQFKHVILSSS